MTEIVEQLWYIHSKDSHTNEAIANMPPGLRDGDNQEIMLLCADGKKRNLYVVSGYSVIGHLERSRKDLKLDFEVFQSQKNGGPVRWKLGEKRKPTLASILTRSKAIKEKIPATRTRGRSPKK